MNTEKWEVREWYISGILTGYRVMRGAGWNAEIKEAFPFNMYIRGSHDRAQADAEKFCRSLNGETK